MEPPSGAVRIAYDIQITGRWAAGRPKLTLKSLTEKDCCEGSSRQLTLKKVDLQCMQLANYLEGGPLMRVMPLHLHVNQKSDYNDCEKHIGQNCLIPGNCYKC